MNSSIYVSFYNFFLLADLSIDEDEEEDDEEKYEDVETHQTPIGTRGEAYITKVLGDVKISSLGFTPPNDPEYFETMQSMTKFSFLFKLIENINF